MARVPRAHLPDGLFHITVRGVGRAAIFRGELDYADFRNHLLRVAGRYDWTLHSYCLMPNHYHLIVEASQKNLSKGMHRLNGRYAQGFNERYERVGHLFQNRFKSHVIESDEHFLRALNYVRANPVAAGLCEHITEWPWADGPYDPDLSGDCP
jgi:REP element-mobilizing transposase RayT